MALVLNEQSRRRFAALEAQALGRGGISLMARISGLARSTIYHGLRDIRGNVRVLAGRIRKHGGGRKKKALEDPSLVADLKSLVEPVTRGDPTQPLLWTTRSLRHLAQELAKKGHKRLPDGGRRSSARHGLQLAGQQQSARRRPAHRSRRAISLHQCADQGVLGEA